MLDQLMGVLAPLGGDVHSAAVPRVMQALLAEDGEIRERLERIDAKLDVLINKDAVVGRRLLNDALQPSLPMSDVQVCVEQARLYFVRAAASAPRDGMSRCIAGVYEAVCWSCLGKRELALRSAQLALVDGQDGLYETALAFNQPYKSPIAIGMGLRKWLPGWDVSPKRRVQQLLEPLVEMAYDWHSATRELCHSLGDPRRHIPICNVAHPAPNGPDPHVARLEVVLTSGETVDVRGIVICLEEAIMQTIDGTEFVDVRFVIDVAKYAKREQAPYNTRPWRIANQLPNFEGKLWVPPPERRPWLQAGIWMDWLPLGERYQTRVTGWRRFLLRDPWSLEIWLHPGAYANVFLNQSDPRPAIHLCIHIP
jgi:hypothetical protein